MKSKGQTTQGKTDLYPKMWADGLIEEMMSKFSSPYEELLDMIPPKKVDPLDEILRLKKRIKHKSQLRKLDVKIKRTKSMGPR